MVYYVCMTDKFMSNWGMAEGKINKYCIECETYEQAQIIYNNALKRSEMKYININMNLPKGKKYLISLKKFSELGEIWTNK
jgi:hypothetical protein